MRTLLPWRLLPLAVAALLVLLAVQPGCTTLSQAPQIEEMSEPDFIAWRTTLVAQVGIVAEAAVAEGEIDPADLEKIASVLTVIGGSNAVEAGELAEWIDLSGYKAALLNLAILELDSKLAAGGGYIDGILSERGKEVLTHLGAKLQAVAVGA